MMQHIINTIISKQKFYFKAICGNPACRGYDNFIKRHNSNKHILKDCIKDRKGDYHDDIIYEIVKGE